MSLKVWLYLGSIQGQNAAWRDLGIHCSWDTIPESHRWERTSLNRIEMGTGC